ncbi:MAG: DEAD/DEAH box helicase [Chitinophagaceae bacterium]|nr:DEAD/DEAH box helicase [Chitinophagaceae bacterium]
MALPSLIKYIYNSGSEEVIRRGKKIFTNRQVELSSHDVLLNSASFHVKDDTYKTYYRVSIQNFTNPKQMMLRCTCAYNLSEICKHEAAALFMLQELIDKNLIGIGGPVTYNQKHTILKSKTIELKAIRMYAGPANYEAAVDYLRTKKCNILQAENEVVAAEVKDNGETYKVILKKNESQYFDTSCTCDEQAYALCRHKTALFLQLLNNFGANYFDSIKNWDRQKEKLLEGYGYSLADDLEGKFEFTYRDGKPFLKVLDASLKRISAPRINTPEPANGTAVLQEEAVKDEDTEVKTESAVAVVLNANEKHYPFLSFDIILMDYDSENDTIVGKAEKIEPAKAMNFSSISENSYQIIQLVKKLQQSEINKYLNRNSPFSGIWDDINHLAEDQLTEETKLLATEYLQPKLKRLFELTAGTPIFYLARGKSFVTDNLEEVSISDFHPLLSFEVTEDEREVVFDTMVKLESQSFLLSDNEWESNLLLFFHGKVYSWDDSGESLLADKFRNPLRISQQEWPEILEKVVIPLTQKYRVDYERKFILEVKEGEPVISVQLIEKGEYLLFQPVFTYKGFTVKPDEKETIVLADNGKVILIKRDIASEDAFVESLNNLHSHFVKQPQTKALALKGEDVLKNNWFFLFIDVMKEKKIPVYGFEALKNYRFNTARPTTKIRLSSNIDWFDAEVELSFGNQRIGISEIQKALANKQSFVQLGDGTLGVLPEEWIRKYALLFKLGDGKKESLRLSKYHLSVIDDLYENRDESEISFELDEKFDRLREFKSIPEVAVPEGLLLTLRPYQLSGYHWLSYLQDVGWGGILADDMGLGKTAQALSAMLNFKEKNGRLKALVVCPTTLIYNWENEIKKFTSNLSYHIHHGSLRTRNISELESHEIIITTYGTLRSDIQLLMKSTFDYAVLDESQAIKNPFSKVTKAACLLQAANKICMSGTPLQNNTFDLYAQMNFLNPGLLGSVEFFRNEFSTPIDKFGEKDQKEHLRKLLYPFILRRTKEQVAKDLPEKTETILFCEMEDKQRAIYNSYRDIFRERIIGSIEEQGVARSQFTILQGLMKLRQICDSPAILNEDEKYPNHSIKLSELSRELTENIGEHKALVFSQFLGMLSLIKQQLEKDKIPYEYFDGSTTPADREKAIKNFQNNESCRVFLISLKAGGVGLNLTAADYVYIVDPWWNPAVEQQAIDRTHRIGQTKNIFAYRMICKDTIEDKILKLQERKKTLAKELIADDQAFVKSLTREDVEYLFT